MYDYTVKRVVDDRISALDVDRGEWVHCNVCDCQLRCDSRNLFSSERWNRHVRRSKKHRDAVSGGGHADHIDVPLSSTGPIGLDSGLSPSFVRPAKKRKKLTQLDVDIELQSSQLVDISAQHPAIAACPGALPADTFEILQVFARFGQIPSGAHVIRSADTLGFYLFSTACTKRVVPRRKNQPDCCDPCFALFVDANLKKRIFQNMKTYMRVLAVIESPSLPVGGLADLQNFLKIPVRNMNHAGKKLRLLVEQHIEHHKKHVDGGPDGSQVRPRATEAPAADREAQARAQEAELSLRVARVKAQHELVKLGMTVESANGLLLL